MEYCYYADLGVARTIVIQSHEASHEIYKGTGADFDHQNARMQRVQNGMPFTIYGVFVM